MTTLPDQDTARSLACRLLKEKLAACVNVMPAMTSIYLWKGEVREETECLLMIKTRQACYGRVETLLRAEHPYELPEIMATDITHGLPDYLGWIKESTQE